MRQFVASCDCGFAEAFKTERGARGGLRRHVCTARFIEEIAAPRDDSDEEKIRAYRPLAIKIAWQYSRKGYRYDDAYCDAMIGLWHAAQRWRPDGGASFATYATTRMRGEIIDGRRRESPFPRSLIDQGKAPAVDSLDALLDAEDTRTLIDHLPDPHDSISEWWDDQDRAEHEAENERRLAEAMGTLDQLSRRDQEIVRAYIGGTSMLTIANDHGLTESRICQIWRKWITGLNPDAPTYGADVRRREGVPA